MKRWKEEQGKIDVGGDSYQIIASYWLTGGDHNTRKSLVGCHRDGGCSSQACVVTYGDVCGMAALLF